MLLKDKEELFTLIDNGEYNVLLDQLISEQWNSFVPEWIRENDTEKDERDDSFHNYFSWQISRTFISL